MTRVYLPAAPSLVRRWLSERIVPAGSEGWAVTADVEAAMGDSDLEELEYAVMVAAAEESIGLLGEGDPSRRMVLVVEGRADPVEGSAGRVRLADDVAWAAVASIHVDAAEAEPDVSAARDGLSPELRDRLDGHDLEWFAAQEVAGVVAGVVGGDV